MRVSRKRGGPYFGHPPPDQTARTPTHPDTTTPWIVRKTHPRCTVATVDAHHLLFAPTMAAHTPRTPGPAPPPSFIEPNTVPSSPTETKTSIAAKVAVQTQLPSDPTESELVLVSNNGATVSIPSRGCRPSVPLNAQGTIVVDVPTPILRALAEFLREPQRDAAWTRAWLGRLAHVTPLRDGDVGTTAHLDMFLVAHHVGHDALFAVMAEAVLPTQTQHTSHRQRSIVDMFSAATAAAAAAATS